MKNFQQIASGANTTRLLLEIHQHPELWNRDPERLYPGSPHEHSDDIWIRANDKTTFLERGSFAGFSDEHDSIWYPAYYALPSARQLIFDLARNVEAERIGGIFIWRVKPGQEIHSHSDAGWHPEYYDKFNICLQAENGCAFIWEDDGEVLYENAGEVTRFVNTTQHKVVNESSDDYIVMVVCLKTHDYEQRYKPAGAAA